MSAIVAGYDRGLPGFPRYSVLGDDDLGTYNLQIANATLADNANYECQVGPGGGSPPIRSSARLDILCKYQSLISKVLEPNFLKY